MRISSYPEDAMKTLNDFFHGWLGAIALVLLFNFVAYQSRADEPNDEAGASANPRTARVQRGDLDVTVLAPGTAEPTEVVDVNAAVSGIITKFGSDPAQLNGEIYWNSKVDVGTPLAFIDDSQFRNAVESAQLKLKKSEAELAAARAISAKAAADADRMTQLVRQGGVTTQTADAAKSAATVASANLDAAEARVELQRVAVKSAQIELSNTVIRSPIKGVLLDRRVNVGQIVGPAPSDNAKTPSLFLIGTNPSKLDVWLSVLEDHIAGIKPGETVVLTADAFEGRKFKGHVTQVRLNATMNQNKVSYTVVASVDNSSGTLLPYMTMKGQIKVPTRKNVLYVPTAALHVPQLSRSRETPRTWVDVVETDGPRQVVITTGIRNDDFAEVTSGNLKEGTQLVLKQSRD
jgi:HlyD family secretion protein